jgi:serine O-acetyltransferase
VIQSTADLKAYVRADVEASSFGASGLKTALGWPPLRWTVLLRVAEWAANTWPARAGRAGAVAAKVVERLVQARGVHLGFTIPPNVFGPGLSIAHWGTITINRGCRVGARCRIHPGVVLGTHRGGEPTIGDDVYLGPGAKLMGAITLGDRCAVGANAVVTRSFGDDAVLLGVPAEDRR